MDIYFRFMEVFFTSVQKCFTDLLGRNVPFSQSLNKIRTFLGVMSVIFIFFFSLFIHFYPIKAVCPSVSFK